jgi:FkbM family methyltransferase
MGITEKIKTLVPSPILSKVAAWSKPKYANYSYSQCGEDLIVDFILLQFNLSKIKYLDIGTHHSSYINNTALLYSKGSTGVCIEPDPVLFKEISSNRKKDICLNVGVSESHESTADFFVMSERTLNTFSQEEANHYVSFGKKIVEIINLPLININDVIKKHFESTPDFISLDVEGMDLKIIKSFDFDKYRPKIWCIETLTYSENRNQHKVQEIIDFMISKKYFAYADTFINTIFVDEILWNSK